MVFIPGQLMIRLPIPTSVNARARPELRQINLRFVDRFEGGRVLASRLEEFSGRNDVVVLAVPRGGVPVGDEVAQALHTPLDVFVVRKLGTPGQEELAMGALASGGITVLNRDVIQALGIPHQIIDAGVAREQPELERREREYRDRRPPFELKGRTAILVDDGLATGSSMRVAAKTLRQTSAAQIVVAVPVAAPSACAELEAEVDRIVCAFTPEPFRAVGQWYRDFCCQHASSGGIQCASRVLRMPPMRFSPEVIVSS
jgi:putative phosphoribosyl transferase